MESKESKEFTEIKWAMALTMGLTILFSWVWKFFPVEKCPDYLWAKEDAGVMAWLFGGIAMMYFAMFTFVLLSGIFQALIWEGEKRFIRRFKIRVHWSVGMLASFGITVGSMIGAIFLGVETFDFEALFDMRGGTWPIIGVMALLITGTSFGWALFVVHAKIANHLNRNSPPFLV